MRIGIGYDVHRLAEGRRLIIGGADIPYDRGLLGHSDADVLVHAICDALLGAAGLGDIGRYFPDNSVEFKDIDSMILLHRVVCLLQDHNYSIGNVDSIIIAQKPRMAPYIPMMTANLARVMNIETSQVNIKATTTEGLGFEGSEEGISAQAVVLIDSK